MGGLTSDLRQAPQQDERLAQHSLLLRGEVLGDRLGEPALAGGAIRCSACAAVRGQLDERPPAVRGSGRRAISPSASISASVWAIDWGRTRSASGEVASHRALAVQASEHCALGEGEAVLGAQPAYQVAEHEA